MMDVPLNVDVHCVDDWGGRSITVILNPLTNETTHLVVAEDKPPHTERLVPIKLVVKATPQIILLRCTTAGLSKMDEFINPESIEKQ